MGKGGEPAGKPKPGRRSRLLLREIAAVAEAARLCYGEPVRAEGRTIVPVARVRARGGGGGGDDGAGMGGMLDASPLGFIEVGPEGASFQPVRDPQRSAAAIRSVTATAAGLIAAVVGARALRRGARARALPAPRRLLARAR